VCFLANFVLKLDWIAGVEKVLEMEQLDRYDGYYVEKANVGTLSVVSALFVQSCINQTWLFMWLLITPSYRKELSGA
jgi:hypothetical protein